MEGNNENIQKGNNKIEIRLESNNIKQNEDIYNKSETQNKNEEQKENDKKEEEKKEEEEKYDLNKDYNFLSILQFVNLFHKVLGLSPISTTEFEFSLLHTDMDPLCCNILSKLLLKKEQHRPTKQNKEKDKDKDKDKDNNTNTENNNNNSNEKNSANNNHNSQKENNNNVFNQDNLIQLNEILLKKLNYFYKVYVRYLKKIYNITESSESLKMIKNDVEIYNNNKYSNDYYSFTKQNLSNKYYEDCDIKTELIVKLFRDLDGEHPLRPISNYHELEILMSNKDTEMANSNYNKNNVIELDSNEDNNNTTNFKTFESLKTKQKVILLMFFCNYCMSFSGRQPLYLEEITNNKEDSFVSNKKIMPIYYDKDKYNNYIFPLNKDCRIYKEKINDIEISKSIIESFDIKIKNYGELEKLLEEEKDQSIVKKLKEKLIEFKTNDEEEQKKINANLKKEELYLKAKKLREMNQNCTSEIEKFKNKDFLLMNLSNHMMTRRQLNQITQLSQVTTRNKSNQLFLREKPKELTEEEKHKLKVQRENLERERRMQKRNQIIEKMQREEEYKLAHPEEAKYLNNKKKRDKKRSKKRHTWSDEESEYDENDYEDELIENYNNSESEKKEKKKKKNNSNSIIISDDEEEKVNNNKNKRPKYEEDYENNEDANNNSGEIINEGYLIYRYSSNQIELEGNWYVATDPNWKERVSYLFSGSQLTKQIPLSIENNETNVFMCSANLIECLQIDILFKSCLEFLTGDYSGYFMYYSKTIEERFKMNLDVQDSLVKVFGEGTNSLGNFNLSGYMNFYRNKEVIIEKNNIEDQIIKIAEFKINKIYTMFNPSENEKVIKSYNHRRKKNDSFGDD